MNIPKNFFELEDRDGFIVNERMKHVWAAQLKVLNMVDQICQNHKIKYIAYYGTMLGAARHKGFIPWDDDMDIAMPREDYNRFLSICENELPNYFKVSSYMTTGGNHNKAFAAVMNRTDIGVDESITKEFYDCPFIAGLDIFPLDYINKDPELESIRTTLYTAAYDMALRFDELSQKDELMTNLLRFEELSNIKFNKNAPIRPQLWGAVEKLMSLFIKEESNGLMFVNSKIEKDLKYDFLIENSAIDSIIRIPYETIDIPVPANYKDILTLLYGDWATPVHFVQGHDYPYYKPQLPYLKTPESYTITGGIQ